MEIILLGVVLLVGIGCLILIVRSIKTFIETDRAGKDAAEADYAHWVERPDGYYGIHLTEEQIKNLENGVELPCLAAKDVPIVLTPGETAVYDANGEIIKNNRFFFGQFVLTTKRVVFTGEELGFDLPHSKISSFLPVNGGITIQSGGSIYKLRLDAPYLVKKAFDAVLDRTMSPALRATEHVPANESGMPPAGHADGREFEHYCAELLQKNGFAKVETAQGSRVPGVNLLAVRDGVRYAIQCRSDTAPLSSAPIQEANAGKTSCGCHVGVVMTDSMFSPEAAASAEATGVLLWGRDQIEQFEKQATGAAAKSQMPSEPIAPQTSAKENFSAAPPQGFQDTTQYDEIDGIRIEVDLQSASLAGVLIDNFGIQKDDSDADRMEFLFDVTAKNRGGISEDVDVIINIYAGRRKLCTETEYIYKDSFYKKDSCSVYFNRKNICKMATKIEVYCKKD